MQSYLLLCATAALVFEAECAPCENEGVGALLVFGFFDYLCKSVCYIQL